MGKGPIALFLYFLLLTPLMVYYPSESLSAAREGLQLWLTVLLPALFPFLVVAELILGMGLPRLVGVMLEPLMRPLFRLPGTAAVVVAIGFTTGFPVGAIMTARLIREGALTTTEGERLALFTNNASPLFMLGAVGAGLFGSSEAGLMLAAAHYGANLAVGWLYTRTLPPPPRSFSTVGRGSSLWKRLEAEWKLFSLQSKPPGEILGTAITRGMNNILAIGGYMMFFVVTFRLLLAGDVITPLLSGLEEVLPWLRLTPTLAPGMIAGLLEMSIGCQQIAAAHAPLTERLMMTSFILAWSGISIQAQVSTFLAGTGVRLSRYLLARLAQGFLSMAILYVLLLYLPLPMSSSYIPPLAEFNLWWIWPGKSGLVYGLIGIMLIFSMIFIKGARKK
ncbi:hypothetical protein H1S01_02345 [Heliobacterium chlorum]|uniref:Nucleoside transporter/FeoB GTPase Gate domain-containing protein n=1 Tax=Heliobacterium chlorum TaxID=2698 RepID=A0ABR7SXT2_HELCL|nr:nucleoside recognition domain-containing protein [Heliobacterium chlorum]MBC9783350.1 hypothetical protein [Heliobacterium chlorum]